MWPSTSKLEKIAKDNGRIWTGSNRGVPGVESIAFNLELQVASVEFEPQQCSVDTLLRAVLKARHKLV